MKGCFPPFWTHWSSFQNLLSFSNSIELALSTLPKTFLGLLKNIQELEFYPCGAKTAFSTILGHQWAFSWFLKHAQELEMYHLNGGRVFSNILGTSCWGPNFTNVFKFSRSDAPNVSQCSQCFLLKNTHLVPRGRFPTFWAFSRRPREALGLSILNIFAKQTKLCNQPQWWDGVFQHFGDTVVGSKVYYLFSFKIIYLLMLPILPNVFPRLLLAIGVPICFCRRVSHQERVISNPKWSQWTFSQQYKMCLDNKKWNLDFFLLSIRGSICLWMGMLSTS